MKICTTLQSSKRNNDNDIPQTYLNNKKLYISQILKIETYLPYLPPIHLDKVPTQSTDHILSFLNLSVCKWYNKVYVALHHDDDDNDNDNSSCRRTNLPTLPELDIRSTATTSPSQSIHEISIAIWDESEFLVIG